MITEIAASELSMLPLSSELFRCFSDFFHLTLMLTLLFFQCLAKSVNLEQSTSYKEVSGQFWKSSRSATQPWDFPLTNMKQSKLKTLLSQSSRSFRSSASIWETYGFKECERQWIAAGGQRSNSNKPPVACLVPSLFELPQVSSVCLRGGFLFNEFSQGKAWILHSIDS